MVCKQCEGDSFVQVPDFDKTLTACLDCGEVVSIKFENLDLLKKYQIRLEK